MATSIFEQVKVLLCNNCNLNPLLVAAETILKSVTIWDDLEKVTFSMTVEDAFDIQVDGDDLGEHVETLADLVAMVEAKVKAKVAEPVEDLAPDAAEANVGGGEAAERA